MNRVSRRAFFVALALVGLCASASARADLNGDIHTVLMDPLLARAEVGISVVRLGASAEQSQSIFRHQSDIPLIPASNLKLVTTSAALDAFGPDFKYRTLLARHGEDVILVGDGDPSFGDAELLHKVGWDVTTVFVNWAQGMKHKGVTSVRNVLVDDSIFDQSFAHPHWPADQVHKRYVAQVAGLNLNANCLDFYLHPSAAGQVVRYTLNPPTQYATIKNDCVSGGSNAIWLSRLAGKNDLVLRGHCPVATAVPVSVTIHDPPLFAGTVLAETLAAEGVRVTGSVSRDRTVRATLARLKVGEDASWSLLAIHETPLAQVLARANKDSMNLYAEALCKRLGFAATGEPGSWENGTAAVAAFLKKAGVAEREFHLDDGCGLSKDNVISANALTRVLAYNYGSKHRQAFIESLSVAGSDGTLENRFAGTDLRGRVFGKSGFVNGVMCLSGYLKAKDESWYAFSILMNRIPGGGKPLQEAIVRAVDRHSTSGLASGQ